MNTLHGIKSKEVQGSPMNTLHANNMSWNSRSQQCDQKNLSISSSLPEIYCNYMESNMESISSSVLREALSFIDKSTRRERALIRAVGSLIFKASKNRCTASQTTLGRLVASHGWKEMSRQQVNRLVRCLTDSGVFRENSQSIFGDRFSTRELHFTELGRHIYLAITEPEHSRESKTTHGEIAPKTKTTHGENKNYTQSILKSCNNNKKKIIYNHISNDDYDFVSTKGEGEEVFVKKDSYEASKNMNSVDNYSDGRQANSINPPSPATKRPPWRELDGQELGLLATLMSLGVYEGLGRTLIDRHGVSVIHYQLGLIRERRRDGEIIDNPGGYLCKMLQNLDRSKATNVNHNERRGDYSRQVFTQEKPVEKRSVPGGSSLHVSDLMSRLSTRTEAPVSDPEPKATKFSSANGVLRDHTGALVLGEDPMQEIMRERMDQLARERMGL